MADTKTTALTENTTPLTTDLLYIIDDPGGSPASQKITIENAKIAVLDNGWTPAGETWVYASADDPTYTFTVAGVDLTTKYYAGMRLKLTQSTGGTKYFIVTKTAFSTNTTVTVYGGTDYNLENEAVTAPCWSMMKAPAGFPLDPTKWTVEVSDANNQSQAAPTQNVWYNAGTITISVPIGIWNTSYQAAPGVDDTTATILSATQITLSTANNSESDVDLTAYITMSGASGSLALALTVHRTKCLVIAAKTSYYLNIRTTGSGLGNIYILGANGNSKTIIRAVCAYL